MRPFFGGMVLVGIVLVAVPADAEIEPGVTGGWVPDLHVRATRLLIDRDGPNSSSPINGYVVLSRQGIFTGEPANNLGAFVVDDDYEISGNFLVAIWDTHLLGNVIGEEYLEVNLYEDLTFAYTLSDIPAIFRGTLIIDPIPEPSTLVMLAGGVFGLLLWRGRRRAA